MKYKHSSNKVSLNPKGAKWYNNGIDNIRSKTGCPVGFKEGRILGKWYNNGKTNIRSLNQPEGFKLGRINTPTGFDNSSCSKYTEKQLEFLKNYPKNHQKYHIEQKIPLTRLSMMFGLSPNVCVSYAIKFGLETHNSRCSYPEKLLGDKLIESGLTVIRQSRSIIPPFEIDLFIPNHQLAVEINGLYWHSTLESNYHLKKLQKCNSKNIRLIQFWDTEIEQKFDLIVSMIKSRCGLNQTIGARKCIISEISSKDSSKFLEENHLQGSINSSIRFALYNNKKPVCLMTFGKSRYSKKYQWELHRFCNKKDLNVVGGATKLWQHFKKNVLPESVISYADMRHSDGGLYKQLGFSLSHISPPNYWYASQQEYWPHSRVAFQKHKLYKILPTYDSNLTEIQNMLNNNWYRVFDCGNMVWEWNK